MVYAGRFYQLVTATVVMVVAFAEMTRLYAGVARSNTMLQRERMMLQRAIDAQRRAFAFVWRPGTSPSGTSRKRCHPDLRPVHRGCHMPHLIRAQTELDALA